MRTIGLAVSVVCVSSIIHVASGFVHSTGVASFHRVLVLPKPYLRRRLRPFVGRNRQVTSRSTGHRRPPVRGRNGEIGLEAEKCNGDVLIKFKPSEVEVACKPGEVVLEVAQRCSGMIEDSTKPFCRDGGCYNCEVEVVEATDLGLTDNLVRTCLFKVPDGAKTMTLIQMSSDEAFEDMI